MNLFGCCLLFGFVSAISSKVGKVCKSSTFDENGGETNNKKSFFIYREMQNSKANVGQKGDKGNKGDTGEVNMTGIHELKLQLELGEFHKKILIICFYLKLIDFVVDRI